MKAIRYARNAPISVSNRLKSNIIAMYGKGKGVFNDNSVPIKVAFSFLLIYKEENVCLMWMK